jgi:probable HAF family extracellular repeat protein
MRQFTTYLLSFLLFVAVLPSGAWAQAYTAKFITPIPHYYWTEPYGINSSGEVVGASYSNGEFDNPVAFQWTAAGGTQTLGSVGFSSAAAVNDSGDIVGGDNNPGQAVLWMHDGTMVNLGTLGDTNGNSYAYGINSSDYVVGWSDRPDLPLGEAFLWTPQSGMQDLGNLGGSPAFSYAQAINKSGEVTGYSSTTTQNQYDVFLWTESGGLQDLGPGQGFGINGSGVIVGAQCCSTTYSGAVLWHDGKTEDLGTLGGSYSSASAINASGVVVGSSAITEGSSPYHAFVWTEKGGIQDLNSLLPASTQNKWVMIAAHAINNAGQIAVVAVPVTGTQIYNGFLLSPQMGVALTASPNPSVIGQAVTFTATVTSFVGPPPNGEEVTFTSGITTLGTTTLTKGVAIFQTSSLAEGTHSIAATYAGDINYASAKSAVVEQVVNK